MRRTWILVGMLITIASAASYQKGSHCKEFHFIGSSLKANLAHPDALLRTTSLSQLPRDLLKVPIARDVLTEDLAFYYEQDEDLLGLKGAIKRIAYEHELDWTDRILVSVLNEPAEIALWRDGRGALRHYAVVIHRNALGKMLQQAATVALKDSQLTSAGEIDTARGKATVFALQLNPRRTWLLVSQGDRLVVLSDPGLLFDNDNAMVPKARAAVAAWLENDGMLARQFALDDGSSTGVRRPASRKQAVHTLAIGTPTLALGYGTFVSGVKGVRFDFGGSWSTALWMAPRQSASTSLGDAELWRAAPSSPSACILLPVNWRVLREVVGLAENKPQLPDAATLAALDGAALACWYNESNLYSPVFIGRLPRDLPQRNAVLQALALWAIGAGEAENKTAGKPNTAKDTATVWRAPEGKAAVGTRGAVVVFSPDGALVDKVLDTVARRYPSVADQLPTSNSTLALMTPRPLSAMAEREVLAALSGSGDANLLAAAQAQLPPRMQALATYPPYRLELGRPGPAKGGWQRVEWRTSGKMP